ncbi:class I SAM-dependent methyltransferase [Streptomyces sp. 4N509B]|uniref:class I SAM-dependent methyltransferase n=1 Tax=Streptomyces sp. 4N509B TaxID=3457413 RepID=UPI003FD22DD0
MTDATSGDATGSAARPPHAEPVEPVERVEPAESAETAGLSESTGAQPPDLKAGSHPSRINQERLLADPDDAEAWEGLHATYADQATIWRDWTDTQYGYALPVRQGLRHVRPVDWAVEICCGTGEATGHLAATVPNVVACDLNLGMLVRHADIPGVRWLAADVRQLPLGTGSVPLLVSLNGVFNPTEIARVTRPGGQVLWCTSFRSGTPLYVHPDRMHRLLGEAWTAKGEAAGHGEWTLFTAPSP